MPSFECVKKFVVAHYKHERLYGRNHANGWHDDYGDNIVQGYLEQIKVPNTTALISRHESNTGSAITFNQANVLEFSG